MTRCAGGPRRLAVASAALRAKLRSDPGSAGARRPLTDRLLRSMALMLDSNLSARSRGARSALVLCCVAGLVASAPAQVRMPFERLLGRREAQVPEPIPGVPLAPGERVLVPGFQGLSSVYAPYPATPTYPPGTFGRADGGDLAAGVGLTEGLDLLRRIAAAPTGGWPSWVGRELGEQAAPDVAVLARLEDRVWLLAADDTAFVPLAFYDKLRVLRVGAVMEVRRRGEFQLVFHDGGQLRSSGPARVRIDRLGDVQVELGIERLRHLTLETKTRPVRAMLPDGSVLEAAGCSMYLEAERGRGTVYNYGPAAARLHMRGGSVELPSAHRLAILTDKPSQRFLPAALDLEGAVRTEPRAPRLEVHGEGEGAVVWSGARFRIEAGTVVTLDPLAGAVFPENHP